jgi:HAD superfamily hydrolase (TIGR01662 family)
MKDYDAYLFDWDGTLAQTLEIWLKLMQSQLDKYGVQAADKEIVLKAFGRVENGVVELGLPQGKLESFIAELKVLAPQKIAEAALYPDVPEMLAVLKKQHKKLALITASFREVVDIVMTRHDLLETFDIVIAGEDAKVLKPDPEGLLLAAKHLGVDPRRSLMLGDSDKDLQAANNAGMDSLLFFPKQHELFHTKEELRKYDPRFVIGAWRELLDELQ